MEDFRDEFMAKNGTKNNVFNTGAKGNALPTTNPQNPGSTKSVKLPDG